VKGSNFGNLFFSEPKKYANYPHERRFVMKNKTKRPFLAALAGTAMIPLCISNAGAASQAQINAAIDSGLANLSAQQTGSGYWNYGGYEQAATGAAVYAMLSQKIRWGAVNSTTYQTYLANVNNGITWLLGQASTTTVSTRNDGTPICPNSATSCTAVNWYGAGETTYTTGLVAPALAFYASANPNVVATTSGPLAGMTWTQIAQGITNTFASSQSTSNNGNRWGGWRYYPGEGDSDMSTTQWAVIAMTYDQVLGAVTPDIVKHDLAQHWLPAVQAGDGSACYQPGSFCDNADTGGLLLSLNFVGTPASDPAVQAAIGFVNNTWTTGAYNTWYGNFGHPYAMWAQYKGLETNIGLNNTSYISNLLSPTCGGNSPTTCNWWQDYNQWLVQNQNGDGSWSGTDYWTGVLATSFYLPILGGSQIPTNVCDMNHDGVITSVDIGLISAKLRSVVTPGSLGDWNFDGRITTQDTRGCSLQITQPE
jgi:hypothetical protein